MAIAFTRSLGGLRDDLGRGIRKRVMGVGEQSPPVPMADETDPGLFGPDSVAWRVHRDPAMFVGGLRALLFQTLHPLAMAGVADHSDYRQDPWGRLHRTGAFIGTTTYAPTAEALAAIEHVRHVHNFVFGTAPDGRSYSANDPHLLAWVHVAEVDSFLRAYQRYGARSLSASEADRYVAEMSVVALELGSETVPTTVAGIDDWLHEVRGELVCGPQAKEALLFLLWPPSMPWKVRVPYRAVTAGAVGLLPYWATEMMGVPSPPAVDPLVVRPLLRTMLRGFGWALGSEDGPGSNPVESGRTGDI